MSRNTRIGEQSTPPDEAKSDARDAGEIGLPRDAPEKQIRELEAQYRSIFEAAGEAMFIANLDGVIVEANPAACQMHGYAHNELVGLPASALVHPADLHLIAESTEAARAGGSYLRQGVALHKDGTLFHAEGRVTGFTFKGKPHVLVVVRDITERVQAEEQLREREAQYRSIFEATTDGLVIHDSEGFVVEANAAFCELFGYSHDDVIGLHASEFLHPDDQQLHPEGMQSIEAGKSVRARVVAVRKDGTLFHVDGHGASFLLNGKPHYLGVSRDITEQVRAEEQVREREEQYRSIFESSLDAIGIVDMEGKLAEVNPAYCQMVGYSYDELIGMPGTALVHPDQHHVIAEAMQSIREGNAVQTDLTMVHKDGGLVHVDGRATAFTYKGRPHFLGVSRDITDRLQAEEQLQEREEQYRSIFEATTDGLAIVDIEGRFVEVNPAYCKLTGYSYNELIGAHVSITMLPDDDHLIGEVMQSIREGSPVETRPVLVRKDGALVDIEGYATAFTYKGKPHILGVARDITERVKAEEQLQEREAQYRSIFEATTDGLGILDTEGIFVEVNPAYCKLAGYSRDELVGMHTAVLIHPDYHHLIAEGMQAISEGRDVWVRSVLVRKDGTLLHIEGGGTQFTYKGQPHFLGMARDITERLEAEEHLREKEAQYRSIFESSADGLGIYDQKGFLVEANPAYCQMLGHTHDELIGLHASATVHPDYHHVIAEGLERVNRDVPFRTEIVLIRKDGTSFPAEGGATTFTYRGKSHELVVLRDISERVEAEKQILEREAEYRGIFEATNDGLIIGDLEGHIVEANPAYCQMFGYTRDELIGLDARQLTAPDYRHVVDEALKAEAASGTYQTVAMGSRKDGSTFYADARGTSFLYRGRPHNLSVVQDVTERVRAYELLEQRVEERTRELSTLLDVSHNVSSTLELQPLMEVILDQLEEVVEYAGASVSLVDGDESRIVAFRGAGSAAVALDVRFPLHESALFQEWQGAGPLIIDDVRHDDSPQAVAFRKDDAALMDDSFSYVRSWMAVPMVVNERLVGILTLNGAEPGLYTPHHAELVLGMASQAAIAIENARLYEQTVQRTSELSALLDVSHNVASTLEVKPLLGLILDQLNLVADNDGITLLEVRGDEFVVLLRRVPGHEDQEFPSSYSTQSHGPIWGKLRQGEVVIIGNVRGDDPLAHAYRKTVGDFLNSSLRFEHSFMAVPLMLRDRIIGLLGLSSARSDYYTPHHGEVALAIAQQAAIAIENARLYEQAQELAALEERQRLARELHDSVSQALFGIGLGARTARALIDQDLTKAIESIEYVHSLAKAGMAEMRALIFELRPESLETEGLVQALKKQADAVSAHHEIPIHPSLCDEPDVPLPVKEALYRIAQEALHNAVKHARPRSLEVSLARNEREVVLEIRDDGQGFDTGGSFPGHLGLHSMRERAQRLGGTVEVESRIGEGTRVRVRVPTHSDK